MSISCGKSLKRWPRAKSPQSRSWTQSRLSVVQSLRAKHVFNPDNAAAYQAAPLGPTAVFGTPHAIAHPPKPRRSGHDDDKATVESLLRDAVASVGASGATSSALFETVKALRQTTVGTLNSTLSRMVGKKQVRREGRLYFPSATH
jgi:hypothetical protein